MAVAQVVDTRKNDNNPAQRVTLWGNGRIDVTGGPAITDGPQFFDRLDQPICRAIHISNWSTMAGYVLDKAGGFWPFGGAPSVGVVDSGYGHEVVEGVAYNPFGAGDWYRDWSWDPNTPGRGLVLDAYGKFWAFGGAPLPPRTGNRWSSPLARKLQVQWGSTMRAYTLAYTGDMFADYAAGAATPGWRWPNGDMAVDFVITNWTSPSGYVLDRNAGVWKFGSAIGVYSPNYKLGADRARTLEILSPADPQRFWQVWAGGQEQEWVASSPPTVVAGGTDPVSPAATVSGTTRPVLSWSYSDPQQDSQALVPLLVFTEAFVTGHNMTDPAVHAASAVVSEEIRDPNVRGIASPVDLENGAYRMYVRAQDSAGQWSPWSNRAWTQNVTPPATPTGLTATANADATVALSVSATTGGTATLVRFERSDDGVTWAAVDGADALSLAATVTAVDHFAPQGKTRTYRAVAYSIDPHTASAPSVTDTATVPVVGFLLHAVNDPTLGGEIGVQGPFQWDREFGGGIFQGLGAKYPTVVDDGEPKARRGSLKVICETAAEWKRVFDLAVARPMVVLRDPLGDVAYCRMVGNWPQRLLEAAPLTDMYATDLPLIEVRPPHLPA